MNKPPNLRLASLALFSFVPGLASAADLLGYYDFDDPSDPAIVPAAGGISPDAAITAPAAFSADQGGHSGEAGDYALDLGDFSGTGAFARVPAGAHLDLAFTLNAIAVSFWQFNVGDGAGGFNNTSAFWLEAPDAPDQRRGFQAHTPWSNGIIYFDQSGCCDPSQRVTAAGAITANTWQHVVFQRDSAGNQEIWVDGSLLASSTEAEVLDPFSGEITIGANVDGGNDFTGRMDEFAIYAGTLTETEIGELAAGTSAPSDIATPPADADSDGLPDAWEEIYGLSTSDDGSVDPNNGPDGDPDSDGLTNAEELDAGLEPNNDDFDDDGLLDGVETMTGVYVDDTDTGTDPKNPDSDGDGLLDGVEIPTESFVDINQPGTDPNKSDTDGDGAVDLLEIEFGSDPTDSGVSPKSDELLLLAYYNFDGQSLDQTGNSPELVLGGPASLTTGGLGTTGIEGDEAIDLGSVNDGSYGQTVPGPHLDQAFLNNALSVAFWQYRTQDGSTSAFWIHSPTSSGGQRGFQAHTPWGNGTIYFDQSGCCGDPQRLTTTGSTLDTWQHFVFQRDQEGFREIWIDGVLAASAADGEPLDPFDGIISVGVEGPNLANSFGGRIDDFAIFSNALTPEQVAALAEGTNPPDLITPPVPFVITELIHDPATGQNSLTWNSRPNKTYAVDFGTDLDGWAELTDSVDSQGEQTSFSYTGAVGLPRQFFRVREVQ